jgi:hypothetical protein
MMIPLVIDWHGGMFYDWIRESLEKSCGVTREGAGPAYIPAQYGNDPYQLRRRLQFDVCVRCRTNFFCSSIEYPLI